MHVIMHEVQTINVLRMIMAHIFRGTSNSEPSNKKKLLLLSEPSPSLIQSPLKTINLLFVS